MAYIDKIKLGGEDYDIAKREIKVNGSPIMGVDSSAALDLTAGTGISLATTTVTGQIIINGTPLGKTLTVKVGDATLGTYSPAADATLSIIPGSHIAFSAPSAGSSTIGLTDSGVSAGTYGVNTATSTKTFKIPEFTVDAKGIITAAGDKTITVPMPDVGAGTLTLTFGSSKTVTFNANQSTSTTASIGITDLGATPITGTIGSASQPVYINAGVITAGNTIPTVNDAALTLKVAGVTKATFTANSAEAKEFNVTAEDLGISGALKFIGEATITKPTVGQYVQADVTYLGEDYSLYVSKTDSGTLEEVAAELGNVFLYKTTEPARDWEILCTKAGLHTASKWTSLGDDSSFARKSTTITGSDGLAGGGDLSANRTITHAIPTGAASITVGLYRFASDKYGHVTGLTPAVLGTVEAGGHTHTATSTITVTADVVSVDKKYLATGAAITGFNKDICSATINNHCLELSAVTSTTATVVTGTAASGSGDAIAVVTGTTSTYTPTVSATVSIGNAGAHIHGVSVN